MSNAVIYAVRRAVKVDVSWAVEDAADRAVYWAAGDAVWFAVDDAVDRAVYWAVRRALKEVSHE